MARQRKPKPPIECAIDGCGVVVSDPCTMHHSFKVCQSDARKLMTGRYGFRIALVEVEPVLDKIHADQRGER